MTDDVDDEQEIETEWSDDDSADVIDEPESNEEFADWVGGDLEAAYLKAMSALEASDAVMPDEDSSDDRVESESNARLSDLPAIPSRNELPTAASRNDHPTAPSRESTTAEGLIADEVTSPTDQPQQTLAEPTSILQQAPSTQLSPVQMTAGDVPPTPRQIIEACLFVGGDALPATRLAAVLRGDFKPDFVDREIDELNRLYAAEHRPYEIRLGEGGYRMALREEHERIRHKVYGLGPKEVRLSQEALEVLSVVAYYQPIKQSRLEELGKPACGAVLRQLVRRELLAVERDPAAPRDVNYKTTARFLSLFGIGSLDELPRSEQVTFK